MINKITHLGLFVFSVMLVASCEDMRENRHENVSHSDDTAQRAHGHGDASGENAKSVVCIMQALNRSTHEITDGIILNDFAKIEASSYAIAHHDPIAKDDLDALFEALGPRKDAFITCDKKVHDAAVLLNDVAKTKKMEEVVDTYADMIEAVASCHRDFKPTTGQS